MKVAVARDARTRHNPHWFASFAQLQLPSVPLPPPPLKKKVLYLQKCTGMTVIMVCPPPLHPSILKKELSVTSTSQSWQWRSF